MLWSIIDKEARQLLSDKGFLIISLIQPLIFIIMFGSSFDGGDINHLDTIIIDEDQSNFSEYVKISANKSEFFEIVEFNGTIEDAFVKFNESEVRSIIHIPDGFQEQMDGSVAGTMDVYIDSSNFLVYSSLSAAKIEIAKDSLENITSDILNEIEEEKEDKIKRFDEIKEIFDEIENESVLLKKNIEELEKDIEDANISDTRSKIDSMDSDIDEAKSFLEESSGSIDSIVGILENLTVNSSREELQKQVAISHIEKMGSQMNTFSEEIESIQEEMDSINIPDIENRDLQKRIDKRRESIDSKVSLIKDKSEELNLDFKKLKRSFLSEPLDLNEIKSHGSIKYFDYLGAGVLSFIVFFVCLLAPALNIVSEKENNTLYRLSTTPFSSIKFFIGKFCVFITFGFIIMFYTLFLSIILYDLRISGSIFNVIFILFLLSCSSISIGLLISSKVKTMQQALVIVPLVVIPSFLISHAFFPPDIMAEFMNYVAYITPMTFSNHALNAIMIKGFGLAQLKKDIFFLLAFTLVPIIFYIIEYRKIKY